MNKLSVAIITYNEERNIARCIKSVIDFASEIIVMDSGSTDETVNIAKSLGAKVYHQPFLGHIQQKNLVLTKTTNQWVLSLDADEAVENELKNNILRVLKKPDADGYEINRLNNYCGKWIKYGAWYPDRKLRLWNKSKGEWTGLNPHDRFRLAPGSKINHLEGQILHYSFASAEEHKIKSERYARLGAEAYHLKGIKANYIQFIYKPAFKFIKDYVLKLGFMDGKFGLIIALINSREVFLKYKFLKRL
jgi:glycosyltransferase involved in cell wall biosynthesis